MKNLKNSTPAEKVGYSGVKITSMIKAIEQQEIFKHLRLVQQDEFCGLRNRYNKVGYLTKPYYSYLWHLYWNFVLNDFRFETEKVWTVVTKHKEIKPEHIDMKILKSMQDGKSI